MNITYLIGAGASYHALPIVEKIPERLEAFAEQFKIPDFEYVVSSDSDGNLALQYLKKIRDYNLKKKEYDKINQFYGNIVWLKDESFKHSSIDTFAKKLYLSKDFNNLRKLKYCLSCFFLYEQTINFDKRYDSFFASIIENLSELPNNIKILSWNYDSQFEIAFMNLIDSGITSIRKTLNIIAKDNLVRDNNIPKDKFSIFKLNGTTNLRNENLDIIELLENFQYDETLLANSFLELFEKPFFRKVYPNMSFAWENFKPDSIFNNCMKESISETDILIIIGYSFPFFNRKIDQFILTAMPNLKKVYVQDPNNAEGIIEKIKGLIPGYNEKVVTKDSRRINFTPKTFVDQFFIPIEF